MNSVTHFNKLGSMVDSLIEDEQSISLSKSEIHQELSRANTEHTIALLIKDTHKKEYKYNHTNKNWYRWNGIYWDIQKTNYFFYLARRYSANASSGKQAQRSSFVKGVVFFCEADPDFGILSNHLDCDRFLLNTPSGTVNLLTSEVLPHQSTNLISNITSVAPDDGYGFRFPQFLSEITCENESLEEFLQITLGACLSGALENHWLIYFVGNGRNGKNTFGDLIMYVLGSYARKIPSSVLMRNKHDNHPTEIANLKGCRLAVASEVDSGAYWHESKLNELTGDTRLSARFMRGDFFEFERTFKFLIYGNHRPRLSSVTEAIRSRIKMVRFNADFSQTADPDLPEKLKKEAGHVLTWLIHGHKKWIDNGKKLPKCEAVENEMNHYIQSQGTPTNWIEECLSDGTSKKSWEKAINLYSHYQKWKLERGEHPVSMNQWGDEMQKHFTKKRVTSGVEYQCILKTMNEAMYTYE
jgi:putative DNA primase/helicase